MPRKNGPWTIKGSKQVYKNHWLSVREDSVISPTGKSTIYGVVKKRDWAMVLAIDKEENAYLVRQFRYALGKYRTEAPAGCIEDGEKPLDSAKRELEEETGIRAKKWRLIGKTNLAADNVENTSYLFLARDLEIGKPHLDGTESLKTLKVPMKEAIKMVENGKITDTTTCYLILRAARVLGNENKL